jgi:hypothetical protein
LRYFITAFLIDHFNKKNAAQALFDQNLNCIFTVLKSKVCRCSTNKTTKAKKKGNKKMPPAKTDQSIIQKPKSSPGFVSKQANTVHKEELIFSCADIRKALPPRFLLEKLT